MEVEQRIFDRCGDILRQNRLYTRVCVMVLYIMAVYRMSYWAALAAWADYEFGGSWTPERWHSYICYLWLKVRIDGRPEQAFDAWAKETTDENRVFATARD